MLDSFPFLAILSRFGKYIESDHAFVRLLAVLVRPCRGGMLVHAPGIRLLPALHDVALIVKDGDRARGAAPVGLPQQRRIDVAPARRRRLAGLTVELERPAGDAHAVHEAHAQLRLDDDVDDLWVVDLAG